MPPSPDAIDKDTPRAWGVAAYGPIPLQYAVFMDSFPADDTHKGYARLVAACEAGDITEVRNILADGALARRMRVNICRKSELYYSPLEAATPYPDIMRILIEREWLPVAPKFEQVARLVCNDQMTQEVLDMLFKAGLMLPFTDEADRKVTLLHWACLHTTSRNVVELLVANNRGPKRGEHPATYDRSALYAAIIQHKHREKNKQETLDFIRWLLTKGVFKNAREKFYDKPLHHAAAMGDVEVARMLLGEFKADVNEINGFGRTPLFEALHWAVGDLEAVPFLLKAGALVTVADVPKKWTPLHAAIRFCYREEHKPTIRLIFDAWVKEAGYKRPNLLLAAAARLEDLELMKKVRAMCQEDDDSKALKLWLDIIHRAMANEKACIKALRRVGWYGLEEGEDEGLKVVEKVLAKLSL
ncbi:ankyrin repeat-containing domain protein [Aspergillus carlsbadensis]|nr:ankyrin repeat-containing domain protein [Aspergillus carlsbadensis]